VVAEAAVAEAAVAEAAVAEAAVAEAAAATRDALKRVVAAVQARGVPVLFEDAPSDDWRYVGIFRGHTIVLYSIDDPMLALFTVVHLFGHLCQLARGDPHTVQVSQYVQPGAKLTETQLAETAVYEFEAAQIGRALLAETIRVTSMIDAAYARLYFADAAYLQNFLRTGERGPGVFERFLAAQRGESLIVPDGRLLRRHVAGVQAEIVVV